MLSALKLIYKLWGDDKVHEAAVGFSHRVEEERYFAGRAGTENERLAFGVWAALGKPDESFDAWLSTVEAVAPDTPYWRGETDQPDAVAPADEGPSVPAAGDV